MDRDEPTTDVRVSNLTPPEGYTIDEEPARGDRSTKAARGAGPGAAGAVGAMGSDQVGLGFAHQEDQPIGQVREGMKVVDAAGNEIGHVAFIKMGDPQTIENDADAPREGGMFDTLAEVFGHDDEPDVPEPLRSQLARVGFIKIDSKGWIGKDHYAAADAIAVVSGETVRLKVPKEELIAEA